MQDVSKKLRVISMTQVKQSAGGVSIKAGVRAGLLVAPVTTVGSTVGTSLIDTPTFPVLDGAGKTSAKM